MIQLYNIPEIFFIGHMIRQQCAHSDFFAITQQSRTTATRHYSLLSLSLSPLSLYSCLYHDLKLHMSLVRTTLRHRRRMLVIDAKVPRGITHSSSSVHKERRFRKEDPIISEELLRASEYTLHLRVSARRKTEF